MKNSIYLKINKIFTEKDLGIFSEALLRLPMADTINAKNFSCEKCAFKCSKKSNFAKHLTTRRHKILTNDLQKNADNFNHEFNCDCGRTYKHRQSLYKHQKECKNLKACDAANESVEPSCSQIEKLTNLIFDVVKQNQELQKQVLELSKEKSIITNSNNNNNTTNNNNKFNLNFFLNEQCKDAMNIMDFVKSLTLQLSDLERVGQVGYAEGISKVFVNGLKDLDVFKRPIHCSDLKRETLYVKDKGIWEKQNEENTKIKMAIKHIAHKNVQQISDWQQENPDYTNPESTVNEEYMKIVNHSMGGFTEQEDETNYNKIIKNVAKEVVIQK
jgi:hypothetical protein